MMMGQEPIFYTQKRRKSIEAMGKEDLKALLKSGTEALGLVFVGYESVASPRQTLLRIYIDTPEGGIKIDACEKASKHLKSVLNVEEVFTGKFALEVSSPGIDRLLFEICDYERYVGESIKVRLHSAVEEMKNFTGVLKRVDNEMIVFVCDDKELNVPFHTIKKANLIFGG